MQPQIHDLGHLFIQRLPLKYGSPLFHKAPTSETEPPYRIATAYIFRFPGTKLGVAIGWWNESNLNEQEALIQAVSGRALPDLSPVSERRYVAIR